MAGIEGRRYDGLGIPVKPLANMNRLQDTYLDSIDLNIIEHNIKQFRKINEL